MDALAGLDAVRWSSLYHAYGTAEDLPGQLRALRSPDQRERRQARNALTGNVYHQGTRWQASPFVVPFLVELVDDPATPERAFLVDLLSAIAIGDRRDDELPFDADGLLARASGVTDAQVDEVTRMLFEGEGEDPTDEQIELGDAVAWRWEADAYRAVAAHADPCRRWLSDPDTGVAARAAALLAWFAPSGRTVAALVDVPADGAREEVRASANLALAHLGAGDADVEFRPIGERLRQLLAAGPEVVRLTAAVALAYRYREKEVGEMLREARERDSLPATPPGWGRAMHGFIALALQRIGPA